MVADLTKFSPDVVEVTVPRNSHGRRHPGCRVRRRDLDTTDVIERQGLRVTNLPLTVVEAAVRRGGGSSLMDSALQRHTDLRALWAAHLRNKGRYGCPRHAGYCKPRAMARDPRPNELSPDCSPEPVSRVGKRTTPSPDEVDFAFTGPKIAIEIDGLAFHSDADDFQRDRIRQNVITLAGWQVLRFTWLDLTEYPERVVAEIRFAISA